MTRSYRPADLHAGSAGALHLAAQGYFWTGLQTVDLPGGKALRGQMYVEYWIPADLRHPLPIVMIHGGGGQGLDYLGTAEGGEGWAHWFVRQGYAVYVVDRPGHGRAPHHPAVQGEMGPPPVAGSIERLFTRPEAFPDQYATAALHDKWPGSGQLGDPAFDAFFAGAGPMGADMEQSHRDCQTAGAALLDLIGPAVLLTHSAGGPTGWLIADARPGLVAGIVAVEPLGPPFAERAGGRLAWGITAAPMTYNPPAARAEEIATEERPAPFDGAVACRVQADPARRLPNLCGFPIVVVTAEASWMSADNHGTVDFLAQAGAEVAHLRLEQHGIHGNGHAMMLERNSREIAALIEGWLRGNGLS
ncbi:alpha/beta fold hydrolase [Pseudooceanicola sp. 216_PA32_1]|uniref:Alpha/beta fold hydrolase n=1 Tax=Pseudooceanicola pacificus TaxID=2676438 RepID=A0A844WCE7_9RHOB|nr:alpha/beta hydrolase [Pseudooceanicola pacificus]MWB79033.1 alpha/beta fold hydrolase [Pseudooceanicola pacificus]